MKREEFIAQIDQFRWPLLVALAAVISAQIDLASSTRIMAETSNVLHVIIFGTIAVLFVLSFDRASENPNVSKPKHFAYSAGLVGFISACVEVLQYFGPRTATLSDWGLSWAGIAAFLGLLLAYRLVVRSSRTAFRAAGVWVGITSIILLGIVVAPYIDIVQAYRLRASAFPALIEFDQAWSAHFVRSNNAELTIGATNNDSAGRSESGHALLEKKKYSGIEVSEPYPDWSGYTQLKLGVSLDSMTSENPILRIEDRTHNDRHDDRFFRRLTLEPGDNSIEIALDDIRRAPKDRDMDLTQIRRIVIYDALPAKPYALYLNDLSLE